MQPAERDAVLDRPRRQTELGKLFTSDDPVLAPSTGRSPDPRDVGRLAYICRRQPGPRPEGGRERVTADPRNATIQRDARGRTRTRAPPLPRCGCFAPYSTRNVASDVSRATIDPPLSRASR